MLEGGFAEGGIAVSSVVVKHALMNVGPGSLGDGNGGVGAEGIKDVNVVRPRDRGETLREVLLLIAGEDEDGDHVRLW